SARGNDERVGAAPLRLDAADDAIDRFDGAEEDAGAKGGLGAASNDGGGEVEVDAGQLRGAAHEDLGAGANARCDDAADERAVGRDAVEGRGRAEVDDDGVAP